jgi:hypothetical protein
MMPLVQSYEGRRRKGLWRWRKPMYTALMSHKVHDVVSLALARRIADGLASHPEWIIFAKANLQRWSALNAGAPRLLACYDEWRAILDRPVEDVRRMLLEESDEGQRRRQNSPFAGIISPAEVRQIKRNIHATIST